MQRVRPGALQRARQGMAAQGAIVLRGDHGSGRSTLLTEVCAGAPTALVALTRLDVEDPASALAALVGRALAPAASPDELVAVLAGRAVAVDDAQWLGEDPARWLTPLVGAGSLVVTLAAEEPGAAALEAALVDAGAEVVELEPLSAAETDQVLVQLGVPEPERALRAASAGGNLALLHHPAVASGDAFSPLALDALTARLAAAGPAGVEVAAALHLAGGAAPLEALDPDGVAALALARWVQLDGPRAVLAQGALGTAALAALGDEAARSLHRALAGHGEPTARVRHLEAAGLADEAVELAEAALAGASLEDRPALLEVIHRARGPEGDAGELLAAALLAAGRAAEAAAVTEAVGAPDLLAGALRQRGRVASALAVLEAAPPERSSGELAQLARWPGPLGLDPSPATVDVLRALDGLIDGDGTIADLLRTAEAARATDAWDDAGRLVTAAALRATVTGEAAASSVAAEGREMLASAPPGPWHHAFAVALRVVDQHAEGAAPALAEALSALVDLDHALPGVAGAHLALAVSDLGRASDALALLDEVAAGERSPRGWDADVLDWARAEVELAAGRPRRARQVLTRPPAGRAGAPGTLLAALRAGTAAWVALELGEPVPPAGEVPSPLALEAEGHRARAAEDLRAAARAYAAAAAAWPSRRAADRARWAAADARWLAGDVDQAVAELRAMEAEAEATGRLPLLARVRSSLRRAGVRTRPARSARVHPGTPSVEAATTTEVRALAALSPREREVLALVAQGLPSGEIADRLGVGRSTVETQVSSAMRKLGARTRRQAAALLVEAGS